VSPSDGAVAIVHSLPGRLRVRIPALSGDAELAESFRGFLLAQAGVHTVRVNRWCASVVIGYDPAVITPPALAGMAERGIVSGVVPIPSPRAPLTLRSLLKRGMPAGLQFGLGAASFAAGLLGAPAPVTYALLGAAGSAILGRALRTLVRERHASVDALDTAAGGLMLLRGNIVSAGFMVALIGLGEYIRARTARRSRSMILDLLGTAGWSAWVVRGGTKLRVPVDQVLVGEVVVVYPGDLVPIDGYVLSGHAMADQRSLTGEAAPVEKRRGDSVYASTVLAEGKLYLRVEAVGEQTRAGSIVESVRAAPLGETRIENYAARLADRLVLPLFAAAIGVYAISRDVTRAISLLIIDFGTGVRIAAPTTILAAMTQAAHRGILIKSGVSIERLARVDAVVFDKTGTLTQGEPEVTEVLAVVPDVPASEVLALAAAAELRLRHPAAHAIVRRARRDRVPIPERSESEYLLGLGVRAEVEGHRLLVGNRLLLEQEGICPCPADHQAEHVAARAESVVYVALDGRLIGLLAYADPLRPESAAVVASLRRLGVKRILMLTGDNEAVAAATSSQVGIREYRAAVFPEQKAAIVRDLQRAGHTVAVVGDGINDSPALVHADVAVSLHHGTDVAREAADVILTDDDLRRVPEAIGIARSAMRLVRENLGIVVVPNGIGLVLAALGLIGPAGATLANNGSTVVAALNSLRPLIASAPQTPAAELPPALDGDPLNGSLELRPLPREQVR
jgi:heavy metal translocating P-type ATPase